MVGRVVCFGEILLRLAAPGAELLLQTPQLKVTLAGAEANVAVSLAQFGLDSAVVTFLPDSALGAAAVQEMRRWGVDVSAARTAPGRMGLYFLTPGAAQRPAEVLYDRAGSAFALAAPDAVDWTADLAGAAWLHISGVTPAIGASAAAAAVRAAKAARWQGVPVSFDCNYRASLWGAWDGDGPAILREIVAEADVVFGDHRDISLILDCGFEGDDDAMRVAAAGAAFEAFPRLTRIASTRRVQHSNDHHDLSGFLFAREGAWTAPSRTVTPIIDRIGGGDAFAAGLIYGLLNAFDDQRMVDFALAATCLKHSIPGDFNLSSVADVERMLAGEGLDVRR